MEVNNVDPVLNNVNDISNNVSNVPKQYVDKSRYDGSVDVVDNEDALKVSISSIYNKQRDELSHSLRSLNEGIAITEISLKGLKNQEENLKNIGTSLIKLEQNGDFENGRFETANEISEQLNEYNREADNARFNKRMLLDDQYGDEIINIVTSNKNYQINGLNTKGISQDFVESIKDNSLSSKNDVNTAIDNLKVALGKNNEYKNNYNELNGELKQVARGTLNDQITLLKENTKIKDLDYAAEFSNFSKENIMAQLGNLAASQAHIIQEQSSKLLV